MGIVITFYSYKGGVGRSMALANTGTLLASWGKRVLLIDWDLEAPGLENYFKDQIKIDASKNEGLINLLARKNNQPEYSVSQIDWSKLLINIDLPVDKTLFPNARLDLLTAGSKDQTYIQNVRALDYDKFYDENEGGAFMEALREHWISEYDFVLIDSRTGLTDSSGVCSIQMPDILVMLFTATDQGFRGTLTVARQAAAAQAKLVYDRYKLKLLPVPTRFDSTEFKLQQFWLGRFTEGLKDVYSTWVPDYPLDKDINIDHRDLLELTKLPYIPYFSYGEKLPVIEHGTKDPQGLGYAYETIAAMLSHKLEGARMLVENRGEFVKRAKDGRAPYDEVATASTPEVKASDPKPSPLKTWYMVAAALVVVLLSVWVVTTSKLTGGNEIKNDSLVYALRASEFMNAFNNTDTSNVQAVLEIKKSLFKNGLAKDTSRGILQARKSISYALEKEIEFDLPMLYAELAQQKFDPHKYYADTIVQLGTMQNVSLSTLAATTNLFNVPGYNNTIENDSIRSFRYDSTGYTVNYVETGNFIHTANGTTYSKERVRVPVTVSLNDELKITRVVYGDIDTVRTTEVTARARTRVDIFVMDNKSSLQLYLTESIYVELQNASHFLPRKRILSKDVNKLAEYQVTRNEIRYNKGEEKLAGEIQQLIQKATQQKFALRVVRTETKNYLSVFIVASEK